MTEGCIGQTPRRLVLYDEIVVTIYHICTVIADDLLTVRLAAVCDANHHHRQHLISQRVDHPLVANAKPIAGLALQGFDVSGGAGIVGKNR
jgi:hypothetical protein